MNDLFDKVIATRINEILENCTLPKEAVDLENDSERYLNAAELLLNPSLDIGWEDEDIMINHYQDNINDFTGEWIIWAVENFGVEYRDIIEQVAMNGFMNQSEEFTMCI